MQKLTGKISGNKASSSSGKAKVITNPDPIPTDNPFSPLHNTEPLLYNSFALVLAVDPIYQAPPTSSRFSQRLQDIDLS